MKQIIAAIAVTAWAVIGLNAQTNTDVPDVPPNAITAPKLTIEGTNSAGGDTGKEYGSYELELGGGSVTSPKTGYTQLGFDVSLSTDPFKKAPNVWIGVDQDLSWQPSFAGETDLFSEYAWHIYKQLWLNTGWSFGPSYDTKPAIIWHTGPEASFEYYIGDSAFLFLEVNDDIPSRGSNSIQGKWGIGTTW